MDDRKRVLSDHKKVKKKLIPPFLYKLGPILEISWVKVILPELFWIAIMHDYHGQKKGVELVLSLSKSSYDFQDDKTDMKLYGSTSSFLKLSAKSKEKVREFLNKNNELTEITSALYPLVASYPDCPLKFLFDHIETDRMESKKYIEYLKKIISELYDKTTLKAILVQATFVYLAFQMDVLKVGVNTSLAKFPEIEKYPNTEISKEVAASIRSAVPAFFNEPHYDVNSRWPSYFWNRGLKISPCTFDYGEVKIGKKQ